MQGSQHKNKMNAMEDRLRDSVWTRKQFLLALSSLVLPACHSGLTLQRQESKGRHIVLGYKGHLYAYSLNAGTFKDVIIENDPHSFTVHPQDSRRVWAVGKWQRAAVEVDIHSGRVLQSVQAPEESPFAGHAVFSADTQSLFFPANNSRTGRGEIRVHSSFSGKLRDIIEVGVNSLHDCQIFADGTLLLTCVGRKNNKNLEWQKTSVFFVDVENKKIKEQRFISDDHQWLTHVTRLGGESYMATSTPYLTVSNSLELSGAVYFGRRGEELKRVILPAEVSGLIKNEFLSTSVDPVRKIAAVTNPRGGNIIWVNSETGEYLGKVSAKANGVSYVSELDSFVFSPFSDKNVLMSHRGRSVQTLPWKNPQNYTFDSGHILVI